jgi:hypothetical protein
MSRQPDGATGSTSTANPPPAATGSSSDAGKVEKAEKTEKVVKVKLLGPRKLTKEQMEAESPRSLWPFALAVTILITCIGLLIHPVIFFLGVVLVIGSITGWLLERRSYLR